MIQSLLNPEVRGIGPHGDAAMLLAAYEKVWDRKRILRQLYETWYRRLFAELRPGNILEVGAGTGNFKRWLRNHGRRVQTLDILRGQFVDLQADAVTLPVRDGRLDNIVMIDALHHFSQPRAFLREAARALRPGGRLLLVEPYVSLWGWFVYKYLHHEGVDFGFQESAANKAAWDGNAAIPQIVLREPLPLQLLRREYCEFLAYPLCGGFSYRCLLPERVLLGMHAVERARLFSNRWLSLRQIAILEKPA